MARIEKTVFISYRRTDVYTALAVYENLKNQGYDVFFDYRSISSGDFEQIITSNIKARAHFLLILTPTALDRCNEPGDWLRREIEFAIDHQRNIIPLFFKGFRFGDPSVTEKLTGKLSSLSRYNGLNIHEDYFDEAMQRLRTQYLNIPLTTVLHPVSNEVQKIVKEEQVAADEALEQIPDVQELVKQDQGKHIQSRVEPAHGRNQPVFVTAGALPHETTAEKPKEDPSQIAVPRTVKEKLFSNLGFNFRLFGAITGGLVIIGLVVWGASSLFSNLPAGPKPTRTPQIRVTFISQPSSTIISEPNQIDTLSPTSALGIGSTITGKDGMTLLYVPAGEFLMGSFFDHDNERMPHTVTLNRFWIDKTEVTVGMYHLCVAAGTCLEPINKTSRTNSTYYDNAKFENYPVIYVNWGMAKTYCEWAGQRLPTEAEWEKAARGNDGRDYPWGNSEPKRDILNFNNQIGDTTEVGKYPKGTSPYGALDMAGNLWEWVADWYGDGYSARDVSNPLGPTSGQFRILRGGAWNKDEKNVHTSTRLPVYASDASNTIGFRCAMSATP